MRVGVCLYITVCSFLCCVLVYFVLICHVLVLVIFICRLYLYFELCFRNTYGMRLWVKNGDMIFSCLEVDGGRIPEFLTKRGVLVWT